MRKRVTFLSVTVLMIFCLSFFPGLPAQQVTAVYLCRSVMEPGTVPVDITKQFDPDAPELHAVVVVDGLQQGMVLKGAWISVDAIDVPNYEIDAAELRVQESGSGRVHFSLSRPTNGWPVGNYRFDFYVNDQPVTSATFSIGGAATSPGRSAPTPPPAKLPPQVSPQPQPQPSKIDWSDRGRADDPLITPAIQPRSSRSLSTRTILYPGKDVGSIGIGIVHRYTPSRGCNHPIFSPRR